MLEKCAQDENDDAAASRRKKKPGADTAAIIDGVETGDEYSSAQGHADGDEVGARLYDERPRPQSGNGKLKSREILLSKNVFDIDKILSRHAEQRAVRDCAAGNRLKAGNLPSAQSLNKTDTHAEISRERDADVNNQATRAGSPDSSASTLPSILRKEPWRRGRHKKTVHFNERVSLKDEAAVETKSLISENEAYDRRDRIIALTRLIDVNKKQAGYESDGEASGFLQKIRQSLRNIRYMGTGFSSGERPNAALLALRKYEDERENLERDYYNDMLVAMIRHTDFAIEAEKNTLANARSALEALERGESLDKVRTRSIPVLRKFAEIELRIERQIMLHALEMHNVAQFFHVLAERAEEAGETEDAGLARMYALIADQLKQLPVQPKVDSEIKARFDADAGKMVQDIIQQLEKGLDRTTERWEQLAIYASQMHALPAKQNIDALIFLIDILADFTPELQARQNDIASAFDAYKEDVEKETKWKADLPLYLKQAEIEQLETKIARLELLSSQLQHVRSTWPPEIMPPDVPGDATLPSTGRMSHIDPAPPEAGPASDVPEGAGTSGAMSGDQRTPAANSAVSHEGEAAFAASPANSRAADGVTSPPPANQGTADAASVNADHATSSGISHYLYGKLVSVGMPLLTYYWNSRIGRYARVAQAEHINLGEDDGSSSSAAPSSATAAWLGGTMLAALTAAATGGAYGLWSLFGPSSMPDGPTNEEIEAEARHQERLAYRIDASLPPPDSADWGVAFAAAGPGQAGRGDTVSALRSSSDEPAARRRRSVPVPYRISQDTFSLSGANDELVLTGVPLQTGTHIRMSALDAAMADYRRIYLFLLMDAGDAIVYNEATSQFEITERETGRKAYFFLEGDAPACKRMTKILRDEIRHYPAVVRHRTFAQRTSYDAVINRCKTTPGAWAGIEVDGNLVDQVATSVHTVPPYASMTAVTPPPSAMTVVNFLGTPDGDHLSRQKLDIVLLLRAGYQIDLLDDPRNTDSFQDSPERDTLSGKPLGGLRIRGKTDKHLFFTASDQATVDHVAGGIYAQMRELNRRTRKSQEDNWSPPALGIPDNVLDAEDQSLFRLMKVEQKADTDFTPLSVGDIAGDNTAMNFMASRGNITSAALRFISSIPILEKEMATRAEQFMMKNWGASVRATETYVIFFDVAPNYITRSNSYEFPADKIKKKIRLDNFFIENYSSDPDFFYSATWQPVAKYCVGLYVDKGGLTMYRNNDRVKTANGRSIDFRDFDREFDKLNLQNEATERIERFWNAEKKQEYAGLLQKNYVHALLNEAQELGKDAFDLAYQLVAPAGEQDETLRVETLDINGYKANDVLVIYRSTGGRVIVYMPPRKNLGERSFVSYKNTEAMKLGMIYRATDVHERESISGPPVTAESPQDLKERFAAEDRLSGATLLGTSGTDDVIDDLGRFFRRGKVRKNGQSVWTADADPKMSGTAEINKQSSSERDVRANPFLSLAEMLKYSMLSEAKIQIVTPGELRNQRAAQAVGAMSSIAGILSLILFPFASFSALVRTALLRTSLISGGTAAATGLDQALNADTPKERTEGWLLAIGGGVDVAFSGLPMPRFSTLKKTGMSGGRYLRLAADFGQEKITHLLRSLGIDPAFPAVSGALRVTEDVAEALFRVPQRLKEGGDVFREKIQKLLNSFRSDAALVQNADIADDIKTARLNVVAKQTQREFDVLFEQEFIKMDLPEEAVGNADDVAERVKAEVRQMEEGLRKLSESAPSVSNEELLTQRKAAQQDVNMLSDDLLHPELFISDTQAFLKDVADPAISRKSVTIGDDGTFTLRGQRYIFVDDVAVRISMIKPGTREAVLQGRATGAPTVMRMSNGEWRMTSKAGLLGGAPEINIGLDTPQLHKMQFEGQTTYQLKLAGEDEFTDVRFDLTKLRWVELNRHGYVQDGGREFEFVSNGWVTHRSGSKASDVSKKKQDDALRQLGFPGMPDIPKYPAKKLLSFPEKIPNMIHHIWIGTGAISDKNIDLLKQTIDLAKRSRPAFDVKLHLGITDAANHAGTMEKLQPLIRNGGFEVVDLYDSQFFRDFKKTELFRIYQAFAEGSDINYAGAVDALRYELANYYGGFYKDMDDEMVRTLDNIKLTKGDVIVPSPRVNSHLGMLYDYNNSLFGTLKGNPTLARLSEEALQQFKQDPNAFKNRPRANKDSTQEEKNKVYEYEHRVSQFVGPHRLSKVISEQVPERGKYLAWSKIRGGGSVELSGKLKDKLAEADKDFAQLDNAFVIKSDESWIGSR